VPHSPTTTIDLNTSLYLAHPHMLTATGPGALDRMDLVVAVGGRVDFFPVRGFRFRIVEGVGSGKRKVQREPRGLG
jgi:hypothetical protein